MIRGYLGLARHRALQVATALAAGLLLLAGTGAAQAQAWPSKPLKLLVGFPAGGASDVMARLIADRLGQALGQSVVVDNRPGAAGTLAASTARINGFDAKAQEAAA